MLMVGSSIPEMTYNVSSGTLNPCLYIFVPCMHGCYTVQRVLHAAARLMLDRKPYDHVAPAFYIGFLACNESSTNCLLVHKALIGQTPDYITNLLMPVTNIPSRSSLRASSNGDLFQPRTERRIGDCAFSVATPSASNRLPTELKLMRSSTATFRRHLKSFLFTPRTDYVMHLRADCRRRTTNAAVTVAVTHRNVYMVENKICEKLNLCNKKMPFIFTRSFIEVCWEQNSPEVCHQ